MDALLIIFLTGLISLFLGMMKKPAYALGLNLLGLSVAFILFWNHASYVSILKSYAGSLVFNGPQIYLSLMAILFTGLVLIGGYAMQSKDKLHYADITSLMMFSLTGALCLIGFKDFFMFFIGLEILSIPVYVLVGSRKAEHLASEAALKYFFTGSFATAILLFGIALVFGATGSFNLNEIGFAVMSGLYTPALMIAGVLLIIASLLFKVGAVPFHFWNADVYEGSSKGVMAYMSTVVKIAGFIALYKLIKTTFGNLSDHWMYFMYAVIIASLFIGYLSGLKQTSLKRLMAFSGISNTGIALLSIMNGTQSGERSLVIFLLGYGASSLILLFISQVVSEEDDQISALEGIGYKNPLLGFSLLVALLSLSGIPPFTGFFGKFLLIKDIIQLHPVLGIAAILSSVIGAYIYLRLILLIFSKRTPAEKIPLDWKLALVLITSLVLLFAGWMLIL
jgi:NADH-quinone oxidoreductase subunit N